MKTRRWRRELPLDERRGAHALRFDDPFLNARRRGCSRGWRRPSCCVGHGMSAWIRLCRGASAAMVAALSCAFGLEGCGAGDSPGDGDDIVEVVDASAACGSDGASGVALASDSASPTAPDDVAAPVVPIDADDASSPPDAVADATTPVDASDASSPDDASDATTTIVLDAGDAAVASITPNFSEVRQGENDLTVTVLG